MGGLSCLALGLFLFQGIDEFDGGEEADLWAVVLDGLDAQCGGDVVFLVPGSPISTA
jgi:hypothetical protein